MLTVTHRVMFDTAGRIVYGMESKGSITHDEEIIAGDVSPA